MRVKSMDDYMQWLSNGHCFCDKQLCLNYVNNQISETIKNIYLFKWLTSRLQGATVEALNRMDPDFIETPRDSPTLQQAPAPDEEINT